MIKAKGFTLVELIIIIVILGVLAVSAAPKFLDITSDAQVASLNGMQAAITSGTDMLHSKAIIDDQLDGDGSVTVNGTNITMYDGYPTGHWQNSMRYIPGLDDVSYSVNSDDVCELDWCGKGNQTSLNSGVSTSSPVVIGKVFPRGFSFNDQCGVYFINNRDGAKPQIALETTDC